MKAKITIKPHVGAMAYTVLAGTLYVGSIVAQQDNDHWELLAFPAHPEDADKEDDKLNLLRFFCRRLVLRTEDLNVRYARFETVPAKLESNNATSIAVTSFGEELARINILDYGYDYGFALKTACTIRNQFNEDWRHKLKRDIVRAYYNKSSNSNEASEE